MPLQTVRPVIHSEHLAAYLILQSSSIHSQNYRKIFTELSLSHHKNKYSLTFLNWGKIAMCMDTEAEKIGMAV